MNRKAFTALGFFSSAMLIAPAAHAVDIFSLDTSIPVGGQLPSISQSVLASGKVKVTLAADSFSGPTYAYLRASSTSVAADDIIVNINTSQLVFLRVTGPSASQNCASIEKIDYLLGVGATGRLIFDAVRCAGNIGTLRADTITITEGIGGNVTTLIEVPNRGIHGELTCKINGSLTGNVNVTNSNINLLDVTGSIGSSGTPITIKGWSQGLLRKLIANTIYADITGETSSVSIAQVQLVQATAGGFAGSLKTQDLAGGTGTTGLLVTGGLNAFVDISGNASNPINIDSIPAGKSINIGGSLTGNLTIGSHVLNGQVSIGRNSPHNSTWSGTTTVGGLTLNPKPSYRLSSQYYGSGSGAIGLVPYKLYSDDCMPPEPTAPATLVGIMGHTAFVNGSIPALMAFYGPMTTETGYTLAQSLKVTRDSDSTDVTSQFNWNL